jgi:hypothetical protein
VPRGKIITLCKGLNELVACFCFFAMGCRENMELAPNCVYGMGWGSQSVQQKEVPGPMYTVASKGLVLSPL